METLTQASLPRIEDIISAHQRLKGTVTHTSLVRNLNLSEKYGADILLKREDLQAVRSYKIRGAYNKISSLSKEEKSRGIVCASAGNHAQGVAYACRELGIMGHIFMPTPTTSQKTKSVHMIGKSNVEVILTGDTFDDCYHQAMAYCKENESVFIHPFNDPQIVEGQGTVGHEIFQDCQAPIDYLFVPVGGGGLISGVGSYFKQISPDTKIIGVEPAGAPAMKASLEAGELVELDSIDIFVDGAGVKNVGDYTFQLARQVIDEMALVHEGKVCSTILSLYNEEAIVVEPAGALTIAVLDDYREQIRGKHVVCIVSGSNNDITRTEEIKERSLMYEGLKHYFIIQFPQRAGALREFLMDVLGPNDDISHFEYSKKTNKDHGPALVGIELTNSDDFNDLVDRLEKSKFAYEYLNKEPHLLQYLV